MTYIRSANFVINVIFCYQEIKNNAIIFSIILFSNLLMLGKIGKYISMCYRFKIYLLQKISMMRKIPSFIISLLYFSFLFLFKQPKEVQLYLIVKYIFSHLSKICNFIRFLNPKQPKIKCNLIFCQ